jgi:small neutral amino acid transporter SnatA (MarC family)
MLPLALIPGEVPFRMPSGLGGFSAVVVRLFQNGDRASTWLAFGLVWVACAIAVLASAWLVFCVGETRKRIFSRQ